MSQTHAPESAPELSSTPRINFSDGNRGLHVQALFVWLPEDLHDAPGIDWTQLPSGVIGYLVNTVGKSPFAASLALAAGVGKGAMQKRSLLKSIMKLNALLRSIHSFCGSEYVSELTKSVWESYVTQKARTPGDHAIFTAYATFTESHLPDYLGQLTPQEHARLAPYVLPRLPRGFRKQYFPNSVKLEGEKQRRKGKSDVLAPLHTLLVALVQFRKQSMQRLHSAYQEALSHARKDHIELPLPFSYEDELVTINRDARTVAAVQLEKHSVTLHFRLWNRRTWVLKHPNDYWYYATHRAELEAEEVSEEPQFFVECLNRPEELLWFGDLIKYRLLRQTMPYNITPEDAKMRQHILGQLGTTHGLFCKRDGLLTPAQNLAVVLSNAVGRTGALVFDADSLCRGALFASALATIALTNGSRLCELLQVSADRFKGDLLI